MSASPPADDFPIDGAPFPFLREFIDANGGEAAFEGLTTDDVKDRFIVPLTQASKLSLCAQMKRAGDARIQPATWFVSQTYRVAPHKCFCLLQLPVMLRRHVCFVLHSGLTLFRRGFRG